MKEILSIFFLIIAVVSPAIKNPKKDCTTNTWVGVNYYRKGSSQHSTHFRIVIKKSEPDRAKIYGDHHICKKENSSANSTCPNLQFRFSSQQEAKVQYTRRGRFMKIDSTKFIGGRYSVPDTKSLTSYCLDFFQGRVQSNSYYASYKDTCDLKGHIIFHKSACRE